MTLPFADARTLADGVRALALSKAYSAAVMQRPTYLLENWRNSDPVFFTQVGRVRPGLPRVGRHRVPAAALSSLFRDGGCDG